MAQTVLGGAIGFLAHLGVHDVVLPFLLVFTLLFAFLEKSKILGLEKIVDGNGKTHTYTRKNLNSMIAFTVAFFVVASSQLVRIISEVMANAVILIVLGLSYSLAMGVFHTGDEEMALPPKMKTIFSVVMAIGVFMILFNALGWLGRIYNFLRGAVYSQSFMVVIMIVFFASFMWFITATPKPKDDKKD